ncbi:MAG: type VI secretion system protein TssA [Acetobacteraceae bacterium]|jgi:type VI secretion system protein ImpA
MADLPEGFDLEVLLAPIPGDAPQGIDIREDYSATSPYNRLRDARSEARDAERLRDARPDAGEGGQSAGDPNIRDPGPLWRTVREVGIKTLAETTKDLEVAAWMTEALVRSHGLAGLTFGARLMAGLAERYWDGLFPLPDDYGMETRVAPVTGLNGRDGKGSLLQPLAMTELFKRSDGTPVAYYQYKSSADLMKLDAEARARRLEGGRVMPFDDMDKEARNRGANLAKVRDATTAARDAWQSMADVMDEKAGADGPPTTAVRELLDEIIHIATIYAPRATAEAEVAPEGAGEAADSGAAPGAGGFGRIAVSPGQLASREDALRALGEIASFFRRSEPHSPLSYTLDEAVRRGRMTWPELLAEVVADTDTRNTILNTLGIRPPPPPEATE